MSDLARPTEVGGEDGRFVRELFVLPADRDVSTELPAPAPGASLRIDGLSVDGFGRLCNLDIDGLADGMTVLVGPNEAGKSTLFDFLTAVLFGFPSRKADSRYRAPVNGGRHGGRVSLVDGSGRWLVERHTSPAKRMSLTRPDGSPGAEGELARLLGGANGELFRAVFAVDLDDLNQLEGMSSDEVREVLFSSSILGQRRSAARAMKELDARRDMLVKPRQGGEANTLAAVLAEARSQLAEARSAATRYAGMRSEGDRLEREVAMLRTGRQEVAARVRELDLLRQCWDALSRRRELESSLSTAPALTADEARRLGVRPELYRLEAQSSGHLERVRAYRQNQAQRAKLLGSIADKAAELGGDWACEVAAAEDFDVDGLRSRIQHLCADLTRANADLRAAAAVVAQARAEMDPGEESDVLGESWRLQPRQVTLDSVDSAQRRLIKLKELRGRLTELEEMVRQVERDAEFERSREAAAAAAPHGRAAAAAPAAAIWAVTVASGCAAALLTAIAVVLFVARQAVGGATLALLAVGFAALCWWVARSVRTRTGADSVVDDEPRQSTSAGIAAVSAVAEEHKAALEERRRRVLAVLDELGLEHDADYLSLVTAQAMIDEAELRLDDQRRAEREAERRALAWRRLAEAEGKARTAADEAEAARRALVTCTEHAGFPPFEAYELPSVVDRLGQLAERLAAVSRIESDLGTNLPSIEAFEREISRLSETFGETTAPPSMEPGGSGVGIGEALAHMIAEADVLHTRFERRKDLESRIADADHDIVRLIGEGARAETVQQELRTGHVLEWAAERETAATRLDELEAQHELAVREHEGITRELHDLARSADVPSLEQRCAELEESLRSIMRGYVRTSGARFLLQRTLSRFEEQRQPAVLSRAGEHFSRVTGGRYVRLGVDSAPDGTKATVRAIRADGHVIDAAELSRGTMEQLYLCLRLGLAESFAEQYSPLPLVLDDVLVNFDPARQEAMARELAVAAVKHQVLFLTCHPHMADLLAQASEDAEVRKIELAPA